MKFTHNKKFKLGKLHVKLEYQRGTNVKMLEFTEPLTKDEAKKVGDLMLGYEKEKQQLLARLAELNDVQVLNSHIAGQPIGIVVPEEDFEKIKSLLD